MEKYGFLEKRYRNDLYWGRFMSVLAAISLILVAVVAIVAMVIVANGNAYQRNSLLSDMFSGSFILNSNDRTVEWDIQHSIDMGDPVQTLQIMGPIPAGQTDGPLFLPLCGVPSTLACDTSVPFVLQDKLTEQSTGYGLKNIIRDIRAAPTRYYFQVGTVSNATGLRAPLGLIGGTP